MKVTGATQSNSLNLVVQCTIANAESSRNSRRKGSLLPVQKQQKLTYLRPNGKWPEVGGTTLKLEVLWLKKQPENVGNTAYLVSTKKFGRQQQVEHRPVVETCSSSRLLGENRAWQHSLTPVRRKEPPC
ncbi:hypothetical protein Salat_0719000 [Sesamum alatum]|uniref:Uncharacterized protein n=1 Tax=Sesamum alatum TaxID=300844 RepID=A0AAE1YRQ6_9LAMI|nr:hypothetical protein Salat_0719000 [Sesamum alatum]